MYAVHGAGYPFWPDGMPWTVITVGEIPASPVRPIPVPVEEENVHPDIGRIIYIAAWYYDQGRRRRNDQPG